MQHCIDDLHIWLENIFHMKDDENNFPFFQTTNFLQAIREKNLSRYKDIEIFVSSK